MIHTACCIRTLVQACHCPEYQAYAGTASVVMGCPAKACLYCTMWLHPGMDGRRDRAAVRPATSSVHTEATFAGSSIMTHSINTAEAQHKLTDTCWTGPNTIHSIASLIRKRRSCQYEQCHNILAYTAVRCALPETPTAVSAALDTS